MAFTGKQHSRFMIASAFIESFCQRYSLPASIASTNYYSSVTIFLPENVSLSSSMLSEWSAIIDKYKSISYIIKIVDGKLQVKID